MTQALVMVVVMIFVFTNFLVDIMYAWLDPRIRYAQPSEDKALMISNFDEENPLNSSHIHDGE